MSPKRLTGVVHLMENAEVITFNPGDILPDWAVDRVTNPDVLEDFDPSEIPATVDAGDAAADAAAGIAPPAATAVADLKGAELKALAKELGVSQAGNKDALIARIIEKQAADAAAEAAAEPQSESDDEDESGADAEEAESEGRGALEDRLVELGLSFEPDATDAELEALIASAE